VRHYYAGSRDVVEMFLRDRWVPEYLDRFVAESEVMDLLTTPDEVFNEEQLERLREEIMAISGVGEVRTPLIVEAVSRVVGDAERGQIMLDFAEVALDEIESQRSELLEPLYLQEQEVLDRLADSYGQLQQAQAQLTAYLASAKDVTRSQDEVLEAMGMRQVRDDALEQAVWLSEELAAAARSGRSAEEAIERMRSLIGSTGPG
jgi:DNA repair exonuclease SbcCD ATPase subunit